MTPAAALRPSRNIQPRLAAAGLAVLVLLLAIGTAHGCGGSGSPCRVEGGIYHLALPEGAQAPVPALVYLHGWGQNAPAVHRRLSDGGAVTGAGLALIVPQGIPREGRTQRDWAVRDGRPHPRDDIAFLERVLADAAARGVDRDRVLLAGFSRGGSFVWAVACERPAFARAYAALAGAFWEPLPEKCAGPVDLHHTHGWTDRVVPLEGRSFRGGAVVQGDVFASLKILRETLGCAARQPEESTAGRIWLRRWTDCRAGRLELLLHPGGHTAPEGWLAVVLAWFSERLGKTPPG